MSTRGVFLGIDFGTTNSSIAYVHDDPRQAESKIIKVETVSVDQDEEHGLKSNRVPTIVSAHFDDRRFTKPLVGWQFYIQMRKSKRQAQLLRHGQTLFRSVKSDIGSMRVYPRAFSPECNCPEKVAGIILSHLMSQAKKVLPGRNLPDAHVVITVPASLNATARLHTREAAISAGLNPEKVEFIDEPIAALIDLLNEPTASAILDGSEPKNLAVFDYGGGTLDISLVRARFDGHSRHGLTVRNLAISQYTRRGGDVIDQAIMEWVVWPQAEESLGVEQDALPADVRRQIEDTLVPTVARGLKEGLCRKVTQKLENGSTWGDLRRTPVSETHELKGRSFSVPGVDGKFPPRFKIDSAQFEELMEPFLEVPLFFSDGLGGAQDSLLRPLLATLQKADLQPDDLDAVVLHGGSCKNPYLRRLMEESFKKETLFSSTQVVHTPDLDSSVARGAALACYWKHARGVEFVTPIVPDDVGIITLNDQPVRLVPGGCPLPFPDEDGVHEVETTFFVPSSGQRQMLVPFYAGSDHQLAGTIKVDIPAQVKRNAPVRIKLRIDRDKLLMWWFNVNGGPYLNAPVLADPWAETIPTESLRGLIEHRRGMRRALLENGALPAWMEAEEASLLWKSDQHEELELLLTDLASVSDPILAARLANLRGLLFGSKGISAERISWHRKAVELKPADAILHGNLGYALLDAGLMDEGIAQIRMALGVDSNLVYLYERLADLYRSRGDESAAVRELREAIRLAEQEATAHPESRAHWDTVSRLYKKVGDYEKAQDAGRRAVNAMRNELYEGDHTLRIAGPDSGFLPSDIDEE